MAAGVGMPPCFGGIHPLLRSLPARENHHPRARYFPPKLITTQLPEAFVSPKPPGSPKTRAFGPLPTPSGVEAGETPQPCTDPAADAKIAPKPRNPLSLRPRVLSDEFNWLGQSNVLTKNSTQGSSKGLGAPGGKPVVFVPPQKNNSSPPNPFHRLKKKSPGGRREISQRPCFD